MLGYQLLRALICAVALLHLNPIVVAQTVDKALIGTDIMAALQPGNTSGSLNTPATASDPTHTNDQLIDRVGRILDEYYNRPPNTRDDSPWKLLHWSIAYGLDAHVLAGGPRGEQVSAIGWLCENRPSAGIRLMSLSRDGLYLPISAGKQGHAGQFLAMLAQSRVQADFGIRVDNRQLTIADLVMHEKDACRDGTELTFMLIGIAHYGGTEDTWKNSRSEQWSVRRLLEEELRQPISSRSTCGGTHRLFAMSYAVHCRRKEGLPMALGGAPRDVRKSIRHAPFGCRTTMAASALLGSTARKAVLAKPGD
jgi:hypothetical protein